ncbi:MAG: hypothetical protein JWP13_629 [Candidatus Saccharibacteria bacterium]|nr:hypothetical protein [Candidatus Saccharibacteria bacterium]
MGSSKHPIENPAFTFSQSIIDMRLTNARGSYLTVIFPPWNGADRLIRILEGRLHRAGSATLTLALHGQILRPDIQGVIDSFTYIQEQVSLEIEKLQDKYAYEAIHLTGISIGTIPLSLVAQRTKHISKATFVVGGSRFAPSVWEGARTQGIRRAFEDKGVSLTELETAWSGLDPAMSATALKGRPVELYISETDTFVPTIYQDELVAALRDSGANVEEHRNKTGHAANIMTYCMKGKL